MNEHPHISEKLTLKPGLKLQRFSQTFVLFSSSLLFSCLNGIPATQAQIIPDATLPVNSTVTPQGNINQITGGTQAGGNLFHSFQEFSIPTGSEAFFNNSLDIQNIFSRVTGNSISNIDGLIRANGFANLFLLNPNGIVFGPNAQLNIGGSFLASTANRINFADGTAFTTVPSETPPLLTVSVPTGLQMGVNPGKIVVEGPRNNISLSPNVGLLLRENRFIGLGVQEQTLALVSADIEVNGGKLTSKGGRIELGSIADHTTVSLNPTNNGWDLGYSEVTEFRDIHLSASASLDASGEGSGRIHIQSRNLSLTEGSVIRSFTEGNQPGQNLTISTTGRIELSGSNPLELPSNILTGVDVSGSSNAGNLTIDTAQLTLTDGSRISSVSFGQGNSGDLTIRATGSVTLSGLDGDGSPSLVGAAVRSGATGDAGNLTIETGQLTLTDGAYISSSTSGQGNAGFLSIRATESVILSGLDGDGSPSLVTAVVRSGATGDVGNLTIETGQITLSDGARINSSTFGQGNAGALTVRASESVALSGLSGNGTPSLVEAVVGSGATGDAGHLTIETGQLILTDGAVISSFTLGQGNAGAVSIQADESVTLSGLDGNGTPSSVAAVVRSGALGDAGNLTIETGRLTLTDGAGIGSATEGQGNAGAVSIQASESVTLSGLSGNGSPSSVQAVVDSEATGDAGNLTIETGQLTLTDGAVINSSTFGQGNAGTLSIQASESVTLSGLSGEGSPSLVEAAVYLGATGDGGNLTIETGQLTLSDGAYINSSTFGQGNAGAVSIQADESVTLSGLSGNGTPSVVAALVAPGATGDGGNLTIATGQLNLTDGSAIGSSTFGQGNAGALSIQADESVTLSGLRNDGTPSVVEARVGSGATGNGGKLTIETGQLTLTDGAFISSTTGGQGNAGALSLQSSESVTLSGLDGNRNPSSVQAAVGLEATGDGGKLTIETGQLTLTDGAFISSSTLGQGNAGALSLQASESITLRGLDRNGTPSFVEAVVAPQATGDAGNLTIKTGRLSLMDAAILSSQTFGNGNAGDVTVRADEVTLRDGARISVSAIGDFSPGVLRVNTDRLFLDTQSSITADTQSGSEGNIEISANSLIMRRNSNITTNARGPATGGNINITTGVLAALENSDINANSEQAQGGTVTIDAEAIFGTEFRESPTSTSDITATGADSSLSGTVSINTPDIDPTSGLVELPTTLTDVAQQIDSSCRPGQQQSEFIVTGRGGLPPNPIEAISDEATWLDLRPGIAGVLSGANRETPSVADASNPVVSSPTPPLVEAQGWVVNAQGKMELVAQGSEVTLQNRTVTPAACLAN